MSIKFLSTGARGESIPATILCAEEKSITYCRKKIQMKMKYRNEEFSEQNLIAVRMFFKIWLQGLHNKQIRVIPSATTLPDNVLNVCKLVLPCMLTSLQIGVALKRIFCSIT